MDRVLVSVIIPMYNDSKYIKECILSVINQDYKNLEIIVVDDGSTDNSAAIVNEIIALDERVFYFYKDNNGQASARNLGVLKSNGEFIAFLDSDDLSFKNRISHQLEIFSKNHELDVVGGGRVDIDITGKIISKEKLLSETDDSLKLKIYKSNPFFTSTVMMKRQKFLETSGFSEGPIYKRAQDYEFWLRLSDNSKFYNIQKALVYYRIQKRSIFKNSFYHSRVLYHYFKKDNSNFLKYWYILRPFLAAVKTKVKF
jgi:teichuronic acid biosynthesis glycosyltransferase TuaG